MPQIEITNEERDSVLTGLRILQLFIDMSDGDLFSDAPPGTRAEAMRDIFTNGGTHKGLSSNDIDDLCVKVNVG